MRLAVFLLAVSQVVVIVQDSLTDVDFLRFLRTCADLKRNLPSVAAAAAGAGEEPRTAHDESLPRVVFVCNRVGDEQLENPETIANVQQVLRVLYGGSLCRFEAKMEPLQAGEFVALTADAVLAGNVACRNRVPLERGTPDLFFFPNHDKGGELRHPFSTYESLFVERLLALPRPKWQRPISERDWLKGATRLWELVNKSAMITEYCNMLHPKQS